jgi:hypothetical protein
MYSNEMLCTKIVGQRGVRAISGKSAVPVGIDRIDRYALLSCRICGFARLEQACGDFLRSGQGRRLCAPLAPLGRVRCWNTACAGPVINAGAAVAGCIFGGNLGFEVPLMRMRRRTNSIGTDADLWSTAASHGEG